MGELCGICEQLWLRGRGEVVWVSMWLGAAAWVSCEGFVNGHGCMVEVKLCG